MNHSTHPLATLRSRRTTSATPSTSFQLLPIEILHPNPFSINLYGDPDSETEGLLESIQDQGILVPLVVTAEQDGMGWEVLSGHRRLACARKLGIDRVPCQVRALTNLTDRRLAVLDYNRQRSKTFSQRMREADALETLLREEANRRRLGNLRRGQSEQPETDSHRENRLNPPDRRNSDNREDPARGAESSNPNSMTPSAWTQQQEGRSTAKGRTDARIAQAIGLGGKDLYRQARAVWKAAVAGDPRARAAVVCLDNGTKTIHSAYKDLRRRDRFATGFRPTPYDVWAFKHDRAFGLPHPGAIPAAIVAHAIHYFSPVGGLVVDPMAGGGTTVDVCASMGRRCLAYDLCPVRPEIQSHDIRTGFPPETSGCDLIFCDPPYHTMLAHRYPQPDFAGMETGIGEGSLSQWIAFLQLFSRIAFLQLAPGGVLALLLANQTEKDLPAGHGYIDHAFLGYKLLTDAGFLPVRRISCPMDGRYRPQDVQRARAEGRLLGQVRDLLVMRKPQPV